MHAHDYVARATQTHMQKFDKKKDWAQVSPKMHAHMIVLQELQINSQAQALLGKKNQAKVYPKMHTHKKWYIHLQRTNA